MKNFKVLLHSEISCVHLYVSGWGGRAWAGGIKIWFKTSITLVHPSWIRDRLVHCCKVLLCIKYDYFSILGVHRTLKALLFSVIVMCVIKSFWSLHAGSGNENEQLKELLALMKEDLTPVEKIYVKKSIEQHKLGTNKTILQQVRSKRRDGKVGFARSYSQGPANRTWESCQAPSFEK